MGEESDKTGEAFRPEHRIAGILVPVFSLRGEGDQGIGDTASLIEFIDWAANNGLALVKTLPINETGPDNSPYNAISSIALDPCLLRVAPEWIPDLVPEDRPLTAPTKEMSRGKRVDYQAVKRYKLDLLRGAFARFLARCATDQSAAKPLARFSVESAEWLEDFSLFRAISDLHGPVWPQWPAELASVARARDYFLRHPDQGAAVAERIAFYKYVQWQAALQWTKVHEHAVRRGVALMGDIPYGVNYYSADVWAERELFRTDWSGGTPPDGFFAHDEVIRTLGQNWGIPLYHWDRMQADGLQWWRGRVRLARRYFDFMRIDHVLGFYRIYGFPWRPERNLEFLSLSKEEIAARTGGKVPQFFPASDEDPSDAARNRAFGEQVLRILLEEAGQHRLVGEDLGFVPPYVRESLEGLGIPGYRIPQWEKHPEGGFIGGEAYPRLSLAIYGTHDHDPLKSVWRIMTEAAAKAGPDSLLDLQAICAYAGIALPDHTEFSPEIHNTLLAALFNSNAWMAVVQVADVFGWEDRINLPGTSNNDNWTSRLPRPIAELHLEPSAPDIRAIVSKSGRMMPAPVSASNR